MSLLLAPPTTYATSTSLQSSAPSAPGVPDTLRSRLGLTQPTEPKSSNTTSFNNSSLKTSNFIAPSSISAHPLQARLLRYRAQQEETQFNILARQYGMAEPMRRRMELAACAEGEWRPAVLGNEARSFGSAWGSGSRYTGSGVHADIMLGREAEITWEDVYVGNGPEVRVPGFTDEMEARVGITGL